MCVFKIRITLKQTCSFQGGSGLLFVKSQQEDVQMSENKMRVKYNNAKGQYDLFG